MVSEIFSKERLIVFCRNAAFSSSIEATCDEEVSVTPNKTFFLLSYVIVYYIVQSIAVVFLKVQAQYPFLRYWNYHYLNSLVQR